MSTPRFLAYAGSRACSASTNAANPPFRWAFAIMCSTSVVFPDDSGPKTSMILPRGTPPTPVRAMQLDVLFFASYRELLGEERVALRYLRRSR